ncbi:MFS permease [Candidatus Rhodobacter oscarellae]|uniref:MFS permease n=1 Tax=Candidatus Rhodobacter oscarellae TaxID=1675527 RepID=A0A0J9E409_9RHOB|nr:MFS transporter [Candidatus Rhodobacter lobularis]KMW57452.1 MFS permease [Candidatus Rhodobacter lobularis]
MKTDAPSDPPNAQLNSAIFAGCMVAFLGFGFAATFGVFLAPISADLGWGREVFSFSVAVQLLTWGFVQPIAGAVADRYGTARVLVFGALAAGAGFALRGVTTDPTLFILTGVLAGAGTGAASFPIVVGALGKIVSPERRSFILGLGTAAASLGMFMAAPTATAMIARTGWSTSLMIIGASFLLILPFLLAIARVSKPTAAGSSAQDFGDALGIAFRDRSYLCLFFGFFVCGFHVAFIQTHLPAYVSDLGLASWVGAWSLALIGLFNIAGTFSSGWAGQVLSKKWVLSGIYLARACVIAVFVLTPISAGSVLVFSAVMGLLWLSTVPLTMGLVALTQGLRFLSTLTGLVFLSHQTGSFMGAWLGGRLYDLNQDYTPMWWAAVVLGLLAALIHLPIREAPGPLAQKTAE